MMRKIRITLITIVSLALLSVLVIPVFAQGSVSYEGQAEGFVFSPGSEDNPTDLFGNFKDVMPGDSLEDKVEIKNNSDKTVKVYMRAEGAGSGEDFLKELKLTVTAEDGTEIFAAPADQKGGLADWYQIGEFAPGDKKTLDLKLEVPITMGDEFQDAAGELGWRFKVEESEEPTKTTETTESTETTEPTEPTDDTTETTEPTQSSSTKETTTAKPTATTKPGGKSTPKTGDETNIILWIAVMGAAVLIIAAAVIVRRKKANKPDAV